MIADPNFFKTETPLDALREAGQQLLDQKDEYLKHWGRSLARRCDLF